MLSKRTRLVVPVATSESISRLGVGSEVTPKSEAPIVCRAIPGKLTSRPNSEVNQPSQPGSALDPEAMAFLEAYPWPGNVRELEHLIEMLVVTAPSNLITQQHLPEKYKRAFALQPGAGEHDTGSNLASATRRLVDEFERGFVLHHLEENH